MLRGKIAGPAIVHADAVHGRLVAFTRGDQVEGDDGEAALDQLAEMIEVEGRGAGDHAADAEIEEILGVLPLARRIAQAVAENHLEAAGLRRDFDGARHGAMKRIGDRGHEQADHRA